MSDSQRRSAWSVELTVVVVLPLVVIGAIVATILVAADAGFTPEPGVQQDRFANISTTATETER